MLTNTNNISLLKLHLKLHSLALLCLLFPSLISAQTSPGGSGGWVRPSGCGLDLEVYFFDSVACADCPLRFAKLAGGTSLSNDAEWGNNSFPLQERIYSQRDSTVAGTVIAEGLRGTGLQGREPHFLVVRGHLFELGVSLDSAVLIEVRLQRKPENPNVATAATDTILRVRKRELRPAFGGRYGQYQELAIPLPQWWVRGVSLPGGIEQAGIAVKWVGGEAVGLRSIGFRDSLGQVIRSFAPDWSAWRERLIGWLEGQVKSRPKVSAEAMAQEVFGSRSGGLCDRSTTARWLIELLVKHLRVSQGLPIEVAEEPQWPLLPDGKRGR